MKTQKQPDRGVLVVGYSGGMQRIRRGAPVWKYDFKTVA